MPHCCSRCVPRLRLPNGAMYALPGRIEFTDNEVDVTTGTVAVRAVFDNPDELLLPGQFVTVPMTRGDAVFGSRSTSKHSTVVAETDPIVWFRCAQYTKDRSEWYLLPH